MTMLEAMQMVGSGATLVGMAFLVYNKFVDPDIKADNRLNLLEQGCGLKHKGIDEKISSIDQSIYLIKENHLRHIEADQATMKNDLTKILTILEAKYQIKVE